MFGRFDLSGGGLDLNQGVLGFHILSFNVKWVETSSELQHVLKGTAALLPHLLQSDLRVKQTNKQNLKHLKSALPLNLAWRRGWAVWPPCCSEHITIVFWSSSLLFLGSGEHRRPSRGGSHGGDAPICSTKCGCHLVTTRVPQFEIFQSELWWAREEKSCRKTVWGQCLSSVKMNT